jgi:hypothetical protein
VVVQRTIDNLKDRPKHERKAVASSIAIGLIVILLLGWAIVFFSRIRSDVQDSNIQDQAASTAPAPTNPITTNTYRTDAQIQQQAQDQFQAPTTSTTIQLKSTTN